MVQLTHPQRAVEIESTSRRATPVVIGSVMAVTLIVKLLSSFIDHRLRRPDASLSAVQHAVLGFPNDRVLRRLGTPSAVTHQPSNVWYYRLNSHDHRVMAVTFERGRATKVEIIQSPV